MKPYQLLVALVIILFSFTTYAAENIDTKLDVKKSDNQKVINITGSPDSAEKQLAEIFNKNQARLIGMEFSCGRKSCRCKGLDDCIDMLTSGPCGKTIDSSCDLNTGKCTCKRPRRQ